MNAEQLARLKKVKLLILDVDGVMTDGRLFWLENQGWTRHFHVKDGYGLKLLIRAGFQVAVISAGNSTDVRHRMEFLGIQHIFLGNEDKTHALNELVSKTGFRLEEMAFMGDELFDIPVLEKVGFSISVPDAVDEVKSRVHYVTKAAGGFGAVREIIDAIRNIQGIGPYLNK